MASYGYDSVLVPDGTVVTASGAGVATEVFNKGQFRGQSIVTAESGLNTPSMTVNVQTSFDNAATDPWRTVASFPAQTAANVSVRQNFPGLDRWVRASWDVTPVGPKATVASVRAGVAAVAEVQTVTITGGADGGTFTLTYAGQITTALAPTVSLADLQAALIALSNIAPGDVVVTGTPGAYVLTFGGVLTGDVAQVTATSSLTGGTTPGVTTATQTAGVAAVTAQQSVTISDTPSGGTWDLSFGGVTTTELAVAATAAAVQAALNALAGFPGCTVAGSDGGPFTVTFTTAGPRALFTSSNTFTGGPSFTFGVSGEIL